MRIFALVMLLAPVSPARAAVTHDIALLGPEFRPPVVNAVQGDQLRWTVNGGRHTITAYNGGTFAFPLVEDGEVRTFSFQGGTALYRCEFHSTLDPLSLVCTGQCAGITARTTAPGVPTITSPAPGQSLGVATIRFQGTAEPQTTVIISEGGTDVAPAVANASGIWRADVFFANGTHTVTARARDIDGRTSPSSPPLTFTVTADTTPPTVRVTSRNPTVALYRQALISGTAGDNLAVDHIDIEVAPLRGFPVVYRSNRCLGCGSPSATWYLEDAIGRGVFTVRAQSIDASGNASEWTEPILVVSGDVSGLL